MCTQFGLTRAKAQGDVAVVAAAVAGWREHFAEVGVSPRDIEQLEEQIDRPFLRKRREEFGPKRWVK